MVPDPPNPEKLPRLTGGLTCHQLCSQFKTIMQYKGNKCLKKETNRSSTPRPHPCSQSLGLRRWLTGTTELNRSKTLAAKVTHKKPRYYSHINNNQDVRLSDKKLISFRAQLKMPLPDHLGLLRLLQRGGFGDNRGRTGREKPLTQPAPRNHLCHFATKIHPGASPSSVPCCPHCTDLEDSANFYGFCWSILPQCDDTCRGT